MGNTSATTAQDAIMKKHQEYASEMNRIKVSKSLIFSSMYF